MLALHLLHQVFFGGAAAAGFGVLFNCPPRFLWLSFGFGALALAVRTAGQEIGGLGLPVASFVAALVLAVLNRIWEKPDSPRGSVGAVVGCIAMIPGSLAAKGLINLFDLMKASPGEGFVSSTAAIEYLMLVGFTLVAIGTALAIPPSCSRSREVMIDLVQFRWRLESPGDPKNSFPSGKTKAARELRLPKKVLTVSSAPAQTSGGTVNG